MITDSAKRRAILATVSFSMVGILAFWLLIDDWANATPLVIFYGVLTVNTYFSIRCFGSITPPGALPQKIFDVILVTAYVALALTVNNALSFILIATLLFAIATIKYIFLTRIVNYPALLQKKIFFDGLGTAACFIALLGTILGHEQVTTMLWAGAFVIGNIYVLWLKPLYRLPKTQ